MQSQIQTNPSSLMPKITIGKTYPASYILEQLNKHEGHVKVGHLLIKNEKTREVKHKYFGEIDLESLKETPVKVLTLINPCLQNFANKILEKQETLNFLKEIENNTNIFYFFDMNDLKEAGYKSKGTKAAIICFNCVLKKKKLPFKASAYKKDGKSGFVKISYKNIKEIEDGELKWYIYVNGF